MSVPSFFVANAADMDDDLIVIRAELTEILDQGPDQDPISGTTRIVEQKELLEILSDREDIPFFDEEGEIGGTLEAVEDDDGDLAVQYFPAMPSGSLIPPIKRRTLRLSRRTN